MPGSNSPSGANSSAVTIPARDHSTLPVRMRLSSGSAAPSCSSARGWGPLAYRTPAPNTRGVANPQAWCSWSAASLASGKESLCQGVGTRSGASPCDPSAPSRCANPIAARSLRHSRGNRIARPTTPPGGRSRGGSRRKPPGRDAPCRRVGPTKVGWQPTPPGEPAAPGRARPDRQSGASMPRWR